MMRRTEDGFSLFELVVGLAILLVILSAGFANLRSGQRQAGSRGLAELITEELRTARRLAMARRHPVAVVFPSDGGSNPCTRSFYYLEGQEQGVPSRVQTLGREYGSGMLFIGSWTGSESFVDPVTSDMADAFDPATWLPPGFTDQALIFMPTGRVRSSGLPVLDGNFHVLAGQDFEYSGLSATSAADPWTVTITPLGEIRVGPGAPGLTNLPAGTLPSPANPPLLPAAANAAPTIDGLDLLPVTNTAVYGANTHGISESLMQLYPEETNSDGMTDYAPITLVTTASDSDADRLFFRLRVAPNRGDFSVQGDSSGWAPMFWDEQAGHWVGTSEWLPPGDAAEGDRWGFVAEVTDGNAIATSASLARFVERSEGQGKITFDKRLFNDATGDSEDAVYVMNLDGTGITKVTNVVGVNENNPDWSPSGTWLAFNSSTNGSPDNADIWITTGDGSVRYNLTDSAGIDEQYPVFSPDGNRLVFLRDGDNDGRYGVFVQNVRQGSTRFRLAGNVTTKRYPASWDPLGEYVCYLAETPEGFTLAIDEAVGSIADHVRIDAADPGRQGTVTDANGLRWDVQEANWCPRDHDGHGQILIRADRDGDGKCGLYLVAVNPLDPYDSTDPLWNPDTDANPPVELLDESYDIRSCSWAPGGLKIAAVGDPDNNGLYQLILLQMDLTGVWPPTIASEDRLAEGFSTFRPRFSEGGTHIVVQSTRSLDVPYSLYRIRARAGATIQLLTSESRDVISHSVTR